MGLAKAKIKVENSGEEISVMFNPEEYAISRSVKYSLKEKPGTEVQDTQFVAVSSSTLSMTLYFNTYTPPTLNILGIVEPEKGKSVAKEVDKFKKTVEIVSDLHRPPTVTFLWGDLQFQGLIEKFDEKYTMFLSDGTPVRATVDITIREGTAEDAAKANKPKESPDRTKARTLKEGEQLWHQAYQEYDDPDQWRVIAKANGIVNPLDVYAGQNIKLPALK